MIKPTSVLVHDLSLSHKKRSQCESAIDEEGVISAGDEEYDMWRAWRIIERSGDFVVSTQTSS